MIKTKKTDLYKTKNFFPINERKKNNYIAIKLLKSDTKLESF